MRYISESTRYLINETASKLATSGKDPFIVVEAFIITNKKLFAEGALGNFWRDVKNWWRGGIGQVHAGRHDVEDEYHKALAAIQTMIEHIKKFKGADPSTEDDVLTLLNNVLDKFESAGDMIRDLSDKVKSSARAERDPKTYGGMPRHMPYYNVEDFASLPTMNIKAEGGTKPIMQWYTNLLRNRKGRMAISILSNAKIQKLQTPLIAVGEKDYDFLANSNDPILQELSAMKVSNRDEYARVFAYLYQKLLATKSDPMGDDPALYASAPPYTKELMNFDKNDINNYMTWLLSLKKSDIHQIVNAAKVATGHRKMSDIIPNVNKANALMIAISNFRVANPSSTAQFGTADEEDLLRAILHINSTKKPTP